MKEMVAGEGFLRERENVWEQNTLKEKFNLITKELSR
jgi:hypothetical protein